MSNFGFLRAEWPNLHAEALHAERLAVADPRASCFYARRTLELTLTWLFEADGTLHRPYRDDLAAMIAEPTLVKLSGPAIRTKMDVIRRQGNTAVHRGGSVASNDAVRVVAELFHVMYWVARLYSRNPNDLPAPGLAFDPAAIPRPLPAEVRLAKQAELKAQAEKFVQQDAELAAQRRKNEDLDAELAALRAEIKAAKAANVTQPDTHDYNEAQTRSLIIDLLLKEAGWKLDQPQDREYPVTGMPVSAAPSGKGKVDYVLWDDDGRPLGLVEAKRTTRDAQSGKYQAQLYADRLEEQFGQRPIIFYTNGYMTFIWDNLNYPPRDVQGFYTKDELRLLIQRRASRLTSRRPDQRFGTTSTTRRAMSRASTPRTSCGCSSSVAPAVSRSRRSRSTSRSPDAAISPTRSVASPRRSRTTHSATLYSSWQPVRVRPAP
ncbi:DUF4145 domain-containing protein [Pseudonocardia saturnea]